jgi:hypothetical protein
MKIPQRVALQSPIKQLRVDRIIGGWRIWLTANSDWSLGTFIELNNDTDSINRITWHPDGTETVFEVTDGQD